MSYGYCYGKCVQQLVLIGSVFFFFTHLFIYTLYIDLNKTTISYTEIFIIIDS